MHGNFATVLGCMDGRCQEKTLAFAKKLFDADYIDTITEPGMDKLLATGERVDWIKSKAEISTKGHGSIKVLITGHCSCAGNPVPYVEHLSHLHLARQKVESWGLFQEIRTACFDEAWNIKEVG